MKRGYRCRPSCPARTPALANVAFHASPASAQAAGYRACKRCLPDATPGSPDWDVAADVAADNTISNGNFRQHHAGATGGATAGARTPAAATAGDVVRWPCG